MGVIRVVVSKEFQDDGRTVIKGQIRIRCGEHVVQDGLDVGEAFQGLDQLVFL